VDRTDIDAGTDADEPVACVGLQLDGEIKSQDGRRKCHQECISDRLHFRSLVPSEQRTPLLEMGPPDLIPGFVPKVDSQSGRTDDVCEDGGKRAPRGFSS
jgi:hypothetical protein